MIIFLLTGFFLGGVYAWAARQHHLELLARKGKGLAITALISSALRATLLVAASLLLGVVNVPGLIGVCLGYLCAMIYLNWR